MQASNKAPARAPRGNHAPTLTVGDVPVPHQISVSSISGESSGWGHPSGRRSPGRSGDEGGNVPMGKTQSIVSRLSSYSPLKTLSSGKNKAGGGTTLLAPSSGGGTVARSGSNSPPASAVKEYAGCAASCTASTAALYLVSSAAFLRVFSCGRPRF